MKLETIPLDLIDEPENAHRLAMDPHALQELADSIRVEGLKNPIAVRPRDNGRYEIIAGHRRFTACRMNGSLTIDAIVRDAGDADTEVERFIENNQREPLTPMEEAVALTTFMESSKLDIPTVSKRLGKSDSWTRGRLALMELSDDLKSAIHAGDISVNAARNLAVVTDDQHRAYLLQYAIASGASAEVIREWVRQWQLAKESGLPENAPRPDLAPPGQPVIIQMPCFTCGDPHPHDKLHIVRVCPGCSSEITNASRATSS